MKFITAYTHDIGDGSHLQQLINEEYIVSINIEKAPSTGKYFAKLKTTDGNEYHLSADYECTQTEAMQYTKYLHDKLTTN